ncbi:MAG: FkbM family methyltransferase [Gammaproteobacteria bacterium]|nr:FkbM family methyltransferase [Gammaproteobacteria bacterium]
MKSFIKNALKSFPLIEGGIRRFILSRFAFPEDEMMLLERSGARFSVAVDIGAAMGHYSWILARKSAAVYAFEPGDHHHGFLSRNVYLSNICLTKAAVGASCGEALLFSLGEGDDANHTATVSVSNPLVAKEGATSRPVEVVSLDYFLGRVTGSVDFIKIDVEGFENDVLAGAAATMVRHRPVVLCEIEIRHNKNADDFFARMSALGYECVYWAGRRFNLFDPSTLQSLQKESDLESRLSRKANGTFVNKYINNFFFFHPDSKLKIKDLVK